MSVTDARRRDRVPVAAARTRGRRPRGAARSRCRLRHARRRAGSRWPTRSRRAAIPSLRFNYPYRSAGKKAPDRPKVLEAATREAAAELARRAKLPPERLVLGGRSMGGRYCSLVVGAADDPLPALGLLFLAYPLHAAGQARPAPRRALPAAHGAGAVRQRHPRLAGGEARAHAGGAAITGPVTFHWIDTADHGYRPLKSSGRTTDDVLAEVAEVSADWVAGVGRADRVDR